MPCGWEGNPRSGATLAMHAKITDKVRKVAETVVYDNTDKQNR